MFPTRFSVSSSDGQVLKQVKISSGILWAMFQKNNSKIQPSGKEGLNDAGTLLGAHFYASWQTSPYNFII